MLTLSQKILYTYIIQTINFLFEELQMKRIFSLILAVLVAIGVFINLPTAKATNASELFSVATDGFSCNGTITYTIYLKQGISFSGALIRFKYDSSVLDVVECEPYMTTDSYGDPIESISGIYESGKISGLDGVHGIIFMYGGDEDYTASSSDKPFVQIRFKLNDNVLSPFSDVSIDISCYEFVSYTNPELNILKGDEQIITTAVNSPKDHSFENNVCSSCGSLCFEYVENESGITITKYNGRKSSLEIPSTVDGFSVTGIGDGIYPLCSNVIDIKIPDSVTNIGANSFYATSFYNNESNWQNGALYIDKFLVATNENLPYKYFVESSTTVIADGAFDSFSGYVLCEKGSTAHKFCIENRINFIIPTITPQDSETTVDFPNQLIFTSILICNNADNLVITPEEITLTANSYSNNTYFGTGSTFTVFDGEDYMGDYTVIVEGDLDGDGVCDVLDAALASLYSADLITPSTNEIYAANGEIAEEIDVLDYQNVVNIALR